MPFGGQSDPFCSSVNEVICHGIPDCYKLQEGDIINIDISVFYKGYHGDLNETFCVGEVAQEYKVIRFGRIANHSLTHVVHRT